MDGPGRHITEALGGRPAGPPSHQEREEQERVQDLVRSVASCYAALAGRESEPARAAELRARVSFHDDLLRRVGAMPPAERHEVLASYPELLRRLRADLAG